MKQTNEPTTPALRQIFSLAQIYAAKQQASQVEPEHLLASLLTVKGNSALQALTALSINSDELLQSLALQAVTPTPSGPVEAVDLSETSRQAIEDARKEAYNLGHRDVDAIHLLLALLYTGTNTVHRLLDGVGLSLYDVRQHILNHPGKIKQRPASPGRLLIRPAPSFLVLLAVATGSGIALNLGGGPDFVRSMTILFILSGWIISVCIHEFGHALAAYLGGDLSVRDTGYLTLDPLKYTHSVFSIMMPLVFLLLGGLGLPGGAVYINTRALRSSRWETLVALAGPLSTTAVGLLIALPFVFGLAPEPMINPSPFWSALAFLGFLQVTALLFNLVPIPPLDGFNMLAPILPADIVAQARRLSGWLFLLFLLLLWYDTPISMAFWSETFRLTNLLGLPPWYVFEGMETFRIF